MTAENSIQPSPHPHLNPHENGNGDTLEKDFSQFQANENGYNNYSNSADSYHMNDMNTDHDNALRRIRTAGSISISPELFEKLYLSPQNKVKGELRKTFGNPTPLCLLGFLLSLTPLSCDLMGWRGAGGNGAAGIGCYYFFGGLLMSAGGFLEFILGNTFPFVVFASFGAFWLTLASTLQPSYFSYGLYAPTGGTETDGLSTVGFTSSFGFFILFMALLCFVYLICSLRTNIAFVVIFLTLVLTFSCLAGSYWQKANSIGNNDASAARMAGRLQVASGACAFVACLAGWWIFASIMLASLDFPFEIPVGDLSGVIKGAGERRKVEEDMV